MAGREADHAAAGYFGKTLGPGVRMEHKRLALPVQVQHRAMGLEHLDAAKSARYAEPPHRVDVSHLRVDGAWIRGAADRARHPACHRVADALTYLPGEREPHLVREHHELAFEAELRPMLARAGIADVHADDAFHELGMTHGELIAEEAAPVVQQQDDALARAALLHHVPEHLHQLIERIGPLRSGVEAG